MLRRTLYKCKRPYIGPYTFSVGGLDHPTSVLLFLSRCPSGFCTVRLYRRGYGFESRLSVNLFSGFNWIATYVVRWSIMSSCLKVWGLGDNWVISSLDQGKKQLLKRTTLPNRDRAPRRKVAVLPISPSRSEFTSLSIFGFKLSSSSLL